MRQERQFKELLRKSGYKATAPRLAVIDVLQKASRPLSAQGIVSVIEKGVDQATVYRTVKSLKNIGVIRQVDLRHNHAHYELANTEEHHHLVCIQCGRVEDVERCGIEHMQTSVLRASKHFSEIRQHALEFYGLCKSCAKKAA